jgi:solute carrier family 8 (sodium/calcium exchanger)
MLVNETKKKKTKKAEEEEDSEEELAKEIRFKVRIESPDPETVKISKKNLCIVTVLPESMENEVNKQQKMVDYFMETRNPSWGSQFKNAIMLSPKIDDDNLIIDDVTCYEALCHFCTITWKVLYAVIPPVKWGHGYYAFFVAMALIGFTTLIVGEAATMLGCVLDIEPAVTAITFVAMGTSLPDTFASMKAARDSESADAAIGNVTGSNAVNVFLGLGLPWVIAAHYEASQGPNSKMGGLYKSPPGTLGFSVVLFLITSITCFILFILRRNIIGGELGGPACSRIGSCIFLIFLWLMYVIFSTLQAYKIINVVIIPAPAGYSST